MSPEFEARLGLGNLCLVDPSSDNIAGPLSGLGLGDSSWAAVHQRMRPPQELLQNRIQELQNSILNLDRHLVEPLPSAVNGGKERAGKKEEEGSNDKSGSGA